MNSDQPKQLGPLAALAGVVGGGQGCGCGAVG